MGLLRAFEQPAPPPRRQAPVPAPALVRARGHRTTRRGERRPSRDRLLDLLRMLALVRVVTWHAYPEPWLTAVAAMPLMFFVAGALLPRVSGLGRYASFLYRRARRVLVPLWLYALAVAGAMLYAPLEDEQWRRLPDIALRASTWALPVVDPASSTWHGGWLSNHLWYLRAYLWVVLLTPLLVVLSRYLVTTALVAAAGITALEMAGANDWPWIGSGPSRVLIGDTVVYGFFAVLGLAYAGRRTKKPLPAWLLATGAAMAAGAAIVVMLHVRPPQGNVNASFGATALVGVAWLLGIGVVERPLRRVSMVRPVVWLSAAFSRRAVTIYLWHPAAIVLGYAVAAHFGWSKWYVAPLTVAFTWVFVSTLGWVEDVAAGRRPLFREPPLVLARTGLALGTAVATLVVAVPMIVAPPSAAVDGGVAARLGLVAPSFRDALSDTAFLRPPPPDEAAFRLRNGKMPSSQLKSTLDRWVQSEPTVLVAGVGVVVQGRTWVGTAGRHQAAAIDPDEQFNTRSLTKTFTAALVARAVDAGKIDPDAPVPRMRGISRPRRTVAITPRQLLEHRSGLIDYTHASGYDADAPLSPARAVNLSLRAPLRTRPGVEVHYTNTAYLYLGVLLEHVHGRPFADLVAELAAELRLDSTKVDPPQPGVPGHAASGISSTLSDLARWGDMLFTPGVVVSAEMVDQLQRIGDHNMGFGTWPVCPCWTDGDGTRRATAMGHHVGFGGLYHYPNQMTLVVRFRPDPEDSQMPYKALADALRTTFRNAMR